jgi:hypothetical protein
VHRRRWFDHDTLPHASDRSAREQQKSQPRREPNPWLGVLPDAGGAQGVDRIRKDNQMMSSTHRLGYAIGVALAATGALASIASSAGANAAATQPAGLTVPADATGAPAVLVASLEGRNEVAGGAPVGQALELIGIHDNTISYSISWRGLGTPTEADIHAGARGVDGPVVVPLFTAAPASDGSASGAVTVNDPTLLAALRNDPGDFYADVHTSRFPSGAVRAQLHLLNHTKTGVAALQDSVIHGSQIYACTQQTDGSFAFTQHDVDAHLIDDIHHTFVQPAAGPPQWQAPDGTAVTGKVVARNANGDGNIAELDLDATQIGQPTGLLGHVVEVFRLNTLGGVAPVGTCDPQATPIVNVPYQADYVFING